MSRNLFAIFTVLMVICGCASVQNNAAQDIEKQEVQQFFQNYVDAWNDHNVENFIALWHEDAKVMTGMRKIVSKEDYKKVLPRRFKDYSTINIVGDPKIKISGNTASVKFVTTYPPMLTQKTNESISLLKQDERWWIIENKY